MHCFMFCRELDYYGIMTTEGITDNESLVKIVNHYSAEPMAKVQKKIDISTEAFDMIKESSKTFLLVVECYGQ